MGAHQISWNKIKMMFENFYDRMVDKYGNYYCKCELFNLFSFWKWKQMKCSRLVISS